MTVNDLRAVPKLFKQIGFGAAAMVVLTGCASGDEAAAPSSTSVPSTTTMVPTTAPPLSAFESNPAVQALRAYLVAVAKAINARNFDMPELLALSTASRANSHTVIYEESLNSYLPGPNPVAVLRVEETSATSRSVVVCSAEEGFALDKPGGKPIDSLSVIGGRFQMVFETGAWKVHSAGADGAISCDGVPLQPPLT